MAPAPPISNPTFDDLERLVYGLRLQVATLYRLREHKGLGTADELRSLLDEIDAGPVPIAGPRVAHRSHRSGSGGAVPGRCDVGTLALDPFRFTRTVAGAA